MTARSAPRSCELMPGFPLTPCLEPRCPHPAVQRGRCERHRQSTTQRGYGRAWQATSRAMRALHGQCERCGAVDDLTTDHLLPRSMGGSDERANLRVLCRSCHGVIGAQGGRAGRISADRTSSETPAGGAHTYKERQRPHEGHLMALRDRLMPRQRACAECGAWIAGRRRTRLEPGSRTARARRRRCRRRT